jgi:6-phosphofructokinase 1
MSAASAFTPDHLRIRSLGPRVHASPLRLSSDPRDALPAWVRDESGVLLRVHQEGDEPLDPNLMLELAGPREKLYFEPKKVRAGIVTCGGLCPGINHVIRAVVMELHHRYGVPEIWGFRYGFEGLNAERAVPPQRLGPDDVRMIHRTGGSMLGLGRGAQDPKVMVDSLLHHAIDMLFVVGGDGTLRGAHALAEEVARRGLSIAVVGIPKTVDNDVLYVDKTFGFETAVAKARDVLDAAHTEALGARNGVGLVKLMGRDSGFIAGHASIASGDVNFCLVPEVPFEMDGDHGLLRSIEARLAERGHALVVVAEGCQAAFGTEGSERDASGNIRYASTEADVGLRLKHSISRHFKARGIPLTLKYFDPSYIIRSVPADAHDAAFCERLGRHAVHAAMAGKTDVLIGRSHRLFTHVPLPLVTAGRRCISPSSDLWMAVTASTGQPELVAPRVRKAQ